MYINWTRLVSSDDLFNERKQRDPNSFHLELSLFVSEPSNASTDRVICAKLLKKLLTEDRDLSTWGNLPISTQSTVKDVLLDRLMHEESEYIALVLGDTVLELGPSLMNSWPELLPSLFRCVTSFTSHKYAKMKAFLIFGCLADKIGETICSSMSKSLHTVLRHTLNNDTINLDVRVAAMSASIELILCISSSNEKGRFQDLIPGMMKTLTDIVSNTNDEFLFRQGKPLACLMKLATYDPMFLRTQLVDVVYTVLDILEAECLGEEATTLGVEFILTLVEAKKRAPGMMKKLPWFIGRCFAMLLNLLVLHIRDDLAWHSTVALKDMTGMTGTFDVGCFGLERFSLALGSKSVTYEAKEQLSAYLVSPEWEKRHAALFAVAHIAKGCPEVMIRILEQVMNLVLNCFQDPHPRVRWAACEAIYFNPHVQSEEYHYQVYLALSAAVDDFHPRVQAHAVATLCVFCGSNKAEALIPHLDGIVNKMLLLIQNENQMVQPGALRTLAVTAQYVEEYFRTYYDTVMPHLKTVLRNADLKSDFSLRASAMMCISAIGMAVGKEKFKEDGKQIMEVFAPFQEIQEGLDDLTTWEMLRACVRICKCIGKELLPYMNAVIPFLIQCLEWHNENHGVDDNGIEKVMVRDKTLWKREYFLKGKFANACDMLGWCAEILKEDFYPWIPQAVSVVFPLLKYFEYNHVRKCATEAMRDMLRCAKLSLEKGIAEGGSFTKLSVYVILFLVDSLHKEQVGDLCAIMLNELNFCLKICGPLLHEVLVRSIVDEIKHVITHSSSRKQELIERAKFEDFDDEEAELLRDERGLEQAIFLPVCNIFLTLIEVFKDAFLPFLDELSSYLLPMLAKEKTTNSERSASIHIFCALMKEFPEAAVKYYDLCLPLILDASNDEDPYVRQCALYGLGLWAENGRSSFKHFVGEALPRINKVIMHSKAREPENESAYGDAVSALGIICEFHGDSIDLSQVIPIWLNCLPIKANLFAAQDVYEKLCLMVERSQKELLGPNNRYIPKIVSVFAEVLCSKKDLVATEETSNCVINVLRHLQKTIPASILLSELPYLLPQNEMELKYILSLDEDANSAQETLSQTETSRNQHSLFDLVSFGSV